MQLIVNCMENLPKKIISQALTYDDVLLVPGYSNVLPREVNINSKLWDIEDDIRECERKKLFDQTFIDLARSVYFTNDERAKVKNDINKAFGSELVEVKSYEEY